jgi:hypothetical protein
MHEVLFGLTYETSLWQGLGEDSIPLSGYYGQYKWDQWADWGEGIA